MLRIYEGLAAARQALALEASAPDAAGQDAADGYAAEEPHAPDAPPPDEALRDVARAAMAAGEGVFAFPNSAPRISLAPWLGEPFAVFPTEQQTLISDRRSGVSTGAAPRKPVLS